MNYPALSLGHYRRFIEASIGPMRKLIESLTSAPEGLALLRAELDALANAYYIDNEIRQSYLLTRAPARKGCAPPARALLGYRRANAYLALPRRAAKGTGAPTPWGRPFVSRSGRRRLHRAHSGELQVKTSLVLLILGTVGCLAATWRAAPSGARRGDWIGGSP